MKGCIINIWAFEQGEIFNVELRCNTEPRFLWFHLKDRPISYLVRQASRPWNFSYHLQQILYKMLINKDTNIVYVVFKHWYIYLI